MVFDEDSAGLPRGLELTALDESFRNDPYPILRRLRDVAPVHLDPQPRRFFVTRDDDARALLHGKEIFMDPRKANPGT